MRKSLLVVFTVLMFSVFSAFAQSTAGSPGATSPSAQGSSSNQSSPAMSGDQSSMSQSSSASGNAAEHTIEGCIVRQETDYYIQPASGQPTKLSGSQDLASHVGHHVVVHGSNQSTSASNASTPGPYSGSAASSGQSSDSSGAFNVTKLEMISTDCPSAMRGNTGSSPDTTNPK
jgi:hypothetical protein